MDYDDFFQLHLTKMESDDGEEEEEEGTELLLADVDLDYVDDEPSGSSTSSNHHQQRRRRRGNRMAKVTEIMDTFINPPAECCLCNGFYGQNVDGQPFCSTCHALCQPPSLSQLPLYMKKDFDDMQLDSDTDSGNGDDSGWATASPLNHSQMATGGESIDNGSLSNHHHHHHHQHDSLPSGDMSGLNSSAGHQLQQQEMLRTSSPSSASSPSSSSSSSSSARSTATTAQQNQQQQVNGGAGSADAVEDKGDIASNFVVKDQLFQQLQALSHYSQNNRVLEAGWMENHFPPEVLSRIFVYLDDISLWSSAQVCKRWSELIRCQTTAIFWKGRVMSRFPLFKPLVTPICWFKTFGKLVGSAPCHRCLHTFLTDFNDGNGEDGVNGGTRVNGQYCSRRLKSEQKLSSGSQGGVDGVQAQAINLNKTKWMGSLTGPLGSPYEGGKFVLSVEVPPNYPLHPPSIKFLTKIFHPNVNQHGDIGMDILRPGQWIPAMTISKLVLCIQSILTDPNPDICMQPEIGRLYKENYKVIIISMITVLETDFFLMLYKRLAQWYTVRYGMSELGM